MVTNFARQVAPPVAGASCIWPADLTGAWLIQALFTQTYALEWAALHGREDLPALGARSPYCTGSYVENLARVFGTRNAAKALLPSLRLPMWPPYGQEHWGATVVLGVAL
jgi:hypothetical protein